MALRVRVFRRVCLCRLNVRIIQEVEILLVNDYPSDPLRFEYICKCVILLLNIPTLC